MLDRMVVVVVSYHSKPAAQQAVHDASETCRSGVDVEMRWYNAGKKGYSGGVVL
jgi:hypothetical protein